MFRTIGVSAVAALAGLSSCSDPADADPDPAGAGGTGGSAASSAGGAASPTGGANSGSGGGDVGPELVLPIERDGKYVLEFGEVRFEVDPARGGRITGFEYGERNVLADAGVTGNATNSGSTFWPSPQADWYTSSDTTWPPIASIDSDAYAAKLEGQTIVLTSPPPDDENLAAVSVVKRFSADLRAEAVVCDFTLKNEGDETVSWAPWQVSRVHPGGITFFPTGSEVVYEQIDSTEAGGITWFEHPAGVPDPLPEWPDTPKLSADAGAPWLAHVADGLAFVKSFPTVSPSELSPGHGEIELYAIAEYVEIEAQGRYTELTAGQSLTWTVRWHLRELPDGVSGSVGEAALVSFVRGVVESR